MGKAPAFQFYPSDWQRDLDDQDLEIEGAWIRICCRLWWSETRGEATKPIREWARILRKTEKKTTEILKILLEKGIASGSVLDNQMVNLISRRMVRDSKISQIRKQVGRLGGNPGLIKIQENLDNQNSSKSASLLLHSSSSSSTSKNNPPTPRKRGMVYADDFLSFWASYPRKVGKDAAYRVWKRLNGTRPALAALVSAIESQTQSDQWQKEGGQFIPHPATWLNQGRWADDPEIKTTSATEQWLKGKW